MVLFIIKRELHSTVSGNSSLESKGSPRKPADVHIFTCEYLLPVDYNILTKRFLEGAFHIYHIEPCKLALDGST